MGWIPPEDYQHKFYRAPQKVSGLLKSTLAKYGLADDVERYTFVLYWKEIVGEEVARRTKPDCIQGQTLIVKVSDSAWAQELSFHKPIILEKLKRYLAKGQEVSDIRFVVGK